MGNVISMGIDATKSSITDRFHWLYMGNC